MFDGPLFLAIFGRSAGNAQNAAGHGEMTRRLVPCGRTAVEVRVIRVKTPAAATITATCRRRGHIACEMTKIMSTTHSSTKHYEPQSQ